MEVLALYGGSKPSSIFNLGTASMASTDSGDVIVAVNTGGTSWRALPDGQSEVFGALGTVAKLDAQAKPVWSVEVPGAATLAAAGDDVWVALDQRASATIAGTTFTLRPGSTGYFALLKLDGSTGAVVDHDQVDFDNQASLYHMLATTSGLWLTGSTDEAIHYGGSKFTRPPAGTYTFLFGRGAPSLRWLPGFPSSLQLTPDGKVFVEVQAEGKDVTLGGATFTPTVRFGQPSFARYTQALAHEASALMPADHTSWVVAPDEASLFWLDSENASGILKQTDYTGATVATGGPRAPLPLFGTQLTLQGGKLLWVAVADTDDSEPATGGTLEGRVVPPKASAVVLFDKASKAIVGSGVFTTFIGTGKSRGYVQGARLSPDGKSALVATTFYDGIAIDGQASVGASGAYGVAFLKLTFKR